jgi:hypothetical protein
MMPVTAAATCVATLNRSSSHVSHHDLHMLCTGFADASLRLMKPRLPNRRGSSDAPQETSPTSDAETAADTSANTLHDGSSSDSSASADSCVGADSSADSSAGGSSAEFDTDSDSDSDSDSEISSSSADADIGSSDSDSDSDDDDDTSAATSETTSDTTTASTADADTAVPAELLKGVHLTLPSEKMAALLAARGSAKRQALEHEQAEQAAAAATAAEKTAAVYAPGDRKRFFVSLMDERIYKVGVFKRLRPRQRVKASELH